MTDPTVLPHWSYAARLAKEMYAVPDVKVVPKVTAIFDAFPVAGGVISVLLQMSPLVDTGKYKSCTCPPENVHGGIGLPGKYDIVLALQKMLVELVEVVEVVEEDEVFAWVVEGGAKGSSGGDRQAGVFGDASEYIQ